MWGCFAVKAFSLGRAPIVEKDVQAEMEQLKATRKALTEMNESYIDLLRVTRETSWNIHETKQLWRSGYKSKLIKIGMAIIVIPEPTPITPTVGACLIAVGAVQNAIRNRALFIEDVKNTFQSTLKEISEVQQSY